MDDLAGVRFQRGPWVDPATAHGTVEIFTAALNIGIRACTVTSLGLAKGRPRRLPRLLGSVRSRVFVLQPQPGRLDQPPIDPKPHGAPGFLAPACARAELKGFSIFAWRRFCF